MSLGRYAYIDREQQSRPGEIRFSAFVSGDIIVGN